MGNYTMCGYRCDLCKAFAPNIKAKDERQALSDVWKKYYDLNISAEQIYCDGCRCTKENAERLDMNCPVRKCVIKRNVDNCGVCSEFPCSTFEERRGLSYEDAKKKLGCNFCEDEYNEYLLAYDNMTTLKEQTKK